MDLLRNPDTKQCRGRLHIESTEGNHYYCAIGLCYVAAGLDPERPQMGYRDLKTVVPDLPTRELVLMNDGKVVNDRLVRKSFAEIADWVEANL